MAVHDVSPSAVRGTLPIIQIRPGSSDVIHFQLRCERARSLFLAVRLSLRTLHNPSTWGLTYLETDVPSLCATPCPSCRARQRVATLVIPSSCPLPRHRPRSASRAGSSLALLFLALYAAFQRCSLRCPPVSAFTGPALYPHYRPVVRPVAGLLRPPRRRLVRVRLVTRQQPPPRWVTCCVFLVLAASPLAPCPSPTRCVCT